MKLCEGREGRRPKEWRGRGETGRKGKGEGGEGVTSGVSCGGELILASSRIGRGGGGEGEGVGGKGRTTKEERKKENENG